jgi:hypothetical protein
VPESAGDVPKKKEYPSIHSFQTKTVSHLIITDLNQEDEQ